MLFLFLAYLLFGMKIVIGDIVKRKERSGQLGMSGNMTASWLFYSGYFIVIDVMETFLATPVPTGRKEVICKIMNSSGELSWISIDCIVKV